MVFIDRFFLRWYIREVQLIWHIKMKKTVKPDFLLDADKALKRKGIEDALATLNERALSDGSRPISISSVMARYRLSCMVILVCSIFSSSVLLFASLYFLTLPSPYTYATTLDGKLYEMKPYKTER